MDRTFAILTVLLPVAVLFLYIYDCDRYKKEPFWWLFAAFLLGVVAACVTAYLGYPMFRTGLYDDLFINFGECLQKGFMQHAIPAEIAKFVMLWLLLHVNKHYDEHIDSIVYSTCIALGYVGAYNLYYFLDSGISINEGMAYTIFLIPIHFCYGAIMGWLYGLSRLSHDNLLAWFLSLIVTIFVDGFTSGVLLSVNLSIDNHLFLPLYFLIAAIALYLLTHWGINHLLEEDESEMNLNEK